MSQLAATKTNIVKGTLGRRIELERFRMKGMQKEGRVEYLSYQYGMLAGLEIARNIFETLEENDQVQS